MPLKPSTVAHLDHVLAASQRDGRLPSVAAGLVRGGELVWSGAAGTVDGRADGRRPDADTQYRMGSITKTFVAVCVLRLRDAGRLELTDRFGDARARLRPRRRHGRAAAHPRRRHPGRDTGSVVGAHAGR